MFKHVLLQTNNQSATKAMQKKLQTWLQASKFDAHMAKNSLNR